MPRQDAEALNEVEMSTVLWAAQSVRYKRSVDLIYALKATSCAAAFRRKAPLNLSDHIRRIVL